MKVEEATYSQKGWKINTYMVEFPMIETNGNEEETRISPALWTTRVTMVVLNFYSVSNAG